ncbi:MAG: T9SS type A sorting domain-containing protein [Bacteroidota bacterium]
MKLFTPFLICALLFQIGNAQTVLSSCELDNNLRFQNDIDYLTFEFIYRTNDIHIDSIELPLEYKQRFLDALAAVYNAQQIPATDLIFNKYDIQTFPYLYLNRFSVSVDTSTSWFKKYKNDYFPTGYSPFDYIIHKYDMDLVACYNWGYLNSNTISLETDQNYNVRQLRGLFMGLEGVVDTGKFASVTDGNHITGYLYDDYTFLEFSRGWEGCQYGMCYKREYWGFNVFADCTVEYIGNYGDVTVTTHEIEAVDIALYPNPVQDRLFIDTEILYAYTIYSLKGIELLEGKASGSSSIDIGTLPDGIYILRLHTESKQYVRKLIKNSHSAD